MDWAPKTKLVELEINVIVRDVDKSGINRWTILKTMRKHHWLAAEIQKFGMVMAICGGLQEITGRALRFHNPEPEPCSHYADGPGVAEEETMIFFWIPGGRSDLLPKVKDVFLFLIIMKANRGSHLQSSSVYNCKYVPILCPRYIFLTVSFLLCDKVIRMLFVTVVLWQKTCVSFMP